MVVVVVSGAVSSPRWWWWVWDVVVVLSGAVSSPRWWWWVWRVRGCAWRVVVVLVVSGVPVVRWVGGVVIFRQHAHANKQTSKIWSVSSKSLPKLMVVMPSVLVTPRA